MTVDEQKEWIAQWKPWAIGARTKPPYLYYDCPNCGTKCGVDGLSLECSRNRCFICEEEHELALLLSEGRAINVYEERPPVPTGDALAERQHLVDECRASGLSYVKAYGWKGTIEAVN